jgi:hypothetical protein
MRVRTLLAIALLLYLPAALAYLDPGTGSLLLQGLIGAFAAAAAAAGLYWSRVKALFRGSSRRGTPGNEKDDTATEDPRYDKPQP